MLVAKRPRACGGARGGIHA